MYSLIDELFDPFIKSSRLSYSDSFPASNVITDSDGCTIELALAGYKKENLHIEVNDMLITITGDAIKDNRTDRKYHNHRIKRNAFKSSYSVPDEYNLNEMEASFEDGILCITIPRREKKETKRLIQIN